MNPVPTDKTKSGFLVDGQIAPISDSPGSVGLLALIAPSSNGPKAGKNLGLKYLVSLSAHPLWGKTLERNPGAAELHRALSRDD
jgi:hypothetical protein